MARSENNPPKETEPNRFVIVKGASVHLLHDRENTYTISQAAYARLVNPTDKAAWRWFQLVETTSAWRNGAHPLPAGSLILVEPKGAVKKK